LTKLWYKGYDLDREIEQFTVGEDYILDNQLVEADVLGSIAHGRMLASIGVLKEPEFKKLKKALLKLLERHRAGKFSVRIEDEDVHTAVENFLVKETGETGKKIHTGRSRNDQVIVDLRIYAREKLLDVKEAALDLVETLLRFAEANKRVPMPGRTHTQLAMPSSVGLWAGAFAESLLDDLKLLDTAYRLNNQCPLGSAASYGVALPLDRKMTADLLGFEKVQNNVLYVNNSRGKVESVILSALVQIMHDLSKLSGDLILFSIPEFGYFTLPEKYCPGSSIMPQKRNPGPLELIRARSAVVQSYLNAVLEIIRTLPSGYNRDLQETKEPLMRGLQTCISSLKVMQLIFENLKVNRENLLSAFKPEIFAADEAIRLAAEGVPFREAYRRVAKELGKLKGSDPVANILSKKHQGATGNLGLGIARREAKSFRRSLEKERKRLESVRRKLLSC